jgi:uncharacterized protein YqeY
MIKDEIRKDLTNAMKNRETLKVSTLRMMLAEIVTKEKEKGESIEDETALRIFYSMIKKREEAARIFGEAGREESAQKEKEEIDIIKNYLPPQLSESEIRDEAKRVIAEVGAHDLKGMGKVMGALSKKLLGKASGSEMSRIVKEELEKLQQE